MHCPALKASNFICKTLLSQRRSWFSLKGNVVTRLHSAPCKPRGVKHILSVIDFRQLTNGDSRASSPGAQAATGSTEDSLTPSLLRKGASPLERRLAEAEDGASSVVDPLSSRNSLAETSQTSAADLSGFSSPSATLRRTPSLYDNVDYEESIEAAAIAAARTAM